MITPAHGADLIENPEYFKDYDLSCLKVIGTGGSPISPQQFLEYKQFFPKSSVVLAYGMTEVGLIFLSVSVQTVDELKIAKKTCIGTPIPGIRYKVRIIKLPIQQ